jgi:hypothetical protein
VNTKLRNFATSLLLASGISLSLTTVASAAPLANNAMIKANIVSSLKVKTLPSKTSPPLAIAASDSFFKFDAKCASGQGSCAYGKRSSKKLIYVFGDDHAQQWLPPLVAAFGARYKIIIMYRSDCHPAEVDVQSTPGLSPDSGCSIWRTNALQTIIKAHPKIIIVAETTSRLRAADGSAMNTATWSTGLLSVLTQLKSSGAKVVLIGDNPAFPVSPSDCLGQHATNVSDCTIKLDTLPAEYQIFTAAETNAASISGSGYIETTKWFCKVTQSQTTCPALINGMLPYADWNRISLTYSRYLTRALKTAVVKSVK